MNAQDYDYSTTSRHGTYSGTLPNPDVIIQITTKYKGAEAVWKFNQDSITIGRPDPKHVPDLDLHPDMTVSRRHARLLIEDDTIWIEDIKSKYGVLVNKQRIRQRAAISRGDVILIGETELTLSIQEQAPEHCLTDTMPNEQLERNISIERQLDIHDSSSIVANTSTEDQKRRLESLFNLPLVFAAQKDLDDLLGVIVQQMIDIIPGAIHSTLLLQDPLTKQLLLKAYVPASGHSVSTTLARRAMSDGCGFIWRRSDDAWLSETMRHQEAQTGMYAPLLWNGAPIGVIAVDSPKYDAAFTEENLRLMMAIGHYASLSVANYQLQQDLQTNARLMETLLCSFSPKIRNILLDRARRGRLCPGGEKSEITILFADIRGFTAKCARMDAADVSEMLNDYFAEMVDAIFRFDGTIDKFVGDAVVAIFGTPETDLLQHEHGVRAGLAMQEAAKLVTQRRAARHKEVCEIGIGIHCGIVLHGFIGAADRLDFTVIGDAVNRASRLGDGAKGGEVLISPDVFRRVFNTVRTTQTTITTKHGEVLEVHRVKSLFDTH